MMGIAPIFFWFARLTYAPGLLACGADSQAKLLWLSPLASPAGGPA